MIMTTWYVLAWIGITIADRITKQWALNTCYKPWLINNYITCELSHNRGVSWSLLQFEHAFGFWCVTVLVATIIAALIVYTWQRFQHKQSIIGEIIVLAGALSNLYDRIMHGGVIDFIVLSYKTYMWPSFNIADIAIVFGVGLIWLNIYKAENKDITE